MKSMTNGGTTLNEIAVAMGRTGIFQSLTEDQLLQAAKEGRLLRLESGEDLVRQGQPLEGFSLILGGELRVLLGQASGGDPLDIARFREGQIVGIADVLLNRPAAVTMTAARQTTVIQFKSSFLEETTSRYPGFGLNLAKTLAERLSKAVERIPVPDADPAVDPTADLLALLPRDFMARHRLLPLALDGEVLTVGMVDNPTPEVVHRLRTYLSAMELRIVRLDANRLNRILSTHLGKEGAAPAAPAHDPALLDRLLRTMATEGASDLHLSGGQRPHWRIDGDMRGLDDLPAFGPETVFEMLREIVPARRREEFLSINDTDFAHEIPGVARFRVNLYRDSGGVGAVFRRIPTAIVPLEKLGMPPVLAGFCSLPKGLVLVTGPTGSGKSTTLAAMVDLINLTRRLHIVTLEDPVEFRHQSKEAFINQREVGSHTESFARALRAVLREDPDVVLIGEMRDLETISLALETANTGHLVLATLHTATAVSTVDRIVGMYPVEEQNRIRATLADVLRGVVSQNLLKRKGGGRVAAVEILVTSYAVANLIREGKLQMIPNAMQTGRAAGNQLLNESLQRLVAQGTVDYEEALSKAVDKADLARRLNRPAPTD
jgi:twitching motility protein PilT